MQDDIIRDFKEYYEKGYITHRDGNACYATTWFDDLSFVLTKSGIDKSKLEEESFIEVNRKLEICQTIGNNWKPSIEAEAHIAALISSGKRCSVHVHSPNTVALFHRKESSTNVLEAELEFCWPELCRYTRIAPTIPFLQPGSKILHDKVGEALSPKYDIVVLQKHGVFAVGDSFQDCKEHIMRLEHVSSIILKAGV